MKKFNITVPKKYTKNGEEKTAWNNVGTLVHFPANGEKSEGYILELNMFPETPFKVFEQRERAQEAPQGYQPTQTTNIPTVKYDENIPF